MKLLGRSPESGEVALAAALETARSELVRVEGEASAAIAAARNSVNVAQSRLDDSRLGTIERAAQAWRQEAERLRRRADETNELETVVVRVAVFGGPNGGSEVVPELRFKQAELNAEAARADAKAQLYENYTLRGRDSAMLATVVAELELPAEAADAELVPA
jgi:hypothetical protein